MIQLRRSIYRSSTVAAMACGLLAQSPMWGQIRKLTTRDLTRLSEVQVADQLKKSDIVFIPVGSVETNGIMPSDRDYVSALGYSMAMAEETGGLYVPGLVHSFPGTTVIGKGTIYMSPSQGKDFLKALTRSLLRQGFRRQVLVSSGHGPAPLTAGTLAREFFEEMHVPILYIDMDHLLPALNIGRDVTNRAIWGSHLMTGRLEDLPLQGDYGAAESKPAGHVAENIGQKTLGKLHYTGSLSLGSWVPDVMMHGNPPPLPATAAEREQWGKEGIEQIKSVVQKIQIKKAVEALKQHDEFTQKNIISKFGPMLPTPDDAQ